MATSNMLANERRSTVAAASHARRHSGVNLIVATSVFVFRRANSVSPWFRYCVYMVKCNTEQPPDVGSSVDIAHVS